MKKTITYHIWPNDIEFGEKLNLLLDHVNEKNYEIKQNAQDPANSFQIIENKYNSYYFNFFQDFIDLIIDIPSFELFLITLHFIKDKDDDQFIIAIIRFSQSSIEVSIQSHDDDLVEITHRFISEKFGLSNPLIPTYDEDRAFYPNPTVFIGRHFDTSSDEQYHNLANFLSLLGFNVKQGEEYASTDIPGKVQKRINKQDIFIALLTGDRGHDWITSESSYALGLGKHIILLIEDGITFNPTIIGTDLEQIRFPQECIEKSFVKLIMEFNSIRVKGIL